MEVLDLQVFKFIKNKDIEYLKQRNLKLESNIAELSAKIESLESKINNAENKLADLGCAVKGVYELIESVIKISSKL